MIPFGRGARGVRTKAFAPSPSASIPAAVSA